MNYFAELGALLQQRWTARNRDEDALPDLAMAALAELPPRGRIDPTGVIDWVVRSQTLPAQLDPESKFSDAAITVYAGEGFHIDVLFWVNGTTTVHQHAFSGAFHVLEGSSLHSRYRFERHERMNAHFLRGQAVHEGVELLRAGDSRPIHSGDRLVHSLFHLDQPSVSLVIRTHGDPDRVPQFDYHLPWFAVDPEHRPNWLLKRLQITDLLFASEHPQRARIMREILDGCDFPAAYHVLTRVHDRIAEPRKVFPTYLEMARPGHGDLVDLISPVLDERRRQRSLVMRRGEVRNPDHRYFLALLLTVPRPELILSLVRERAPDRDPIDSVVAWVGELAGTPKRAASEANVLGAPMDETALLIFRYMLERRSVPEILARLEEEYDEVEGQAALVEQMCEAMRASMFFRPLFAGG